VIVPAILSIVTFLPLIGAAVLVAARYSQKSAEAAAPISVDHP
jgi:hypothetical protein